MNNLNNTWKHNNYLKVKSLPLNSRLLFCKSLVN